MTIQTIHIDCKMYSEAASVQPTNLRATVKSLRRLNLSRFEVPRESYANKNHLGMLKELIRIPRGQSLVNEAK